MDNLLVKNYIDSFLVYLEETCNFQKSTVREYNFDLTIFFRFLKFYYKLENINEIENFESTRIDDISFDLLLKISKEDIQAYLYFLAENEYNISTRNRKFYALKHFFNYLKLYKGIIFTNPTANIKVSKVKKSLPIYLSIKDVKKFFSTFRKCENVPLEIRNYAICVLIISLGLRVSEVVNLNMDSFDLNERTILILGKGHKERTLYLSKSCIFAINKYLEIRNDILPKTKYKSDNSLFISKQGKRMSASTIKYIVKKHMSQAKLDTSKYSAHKLRHTTATLLYQNGTDIRTIQEILGHISINSTEIYTHLGDTEVKKGINKNPLSNFHKEVKNYYEKTN